MEKQKCDWCEEEAEEESMLCFSCRWEAMSGVEQEEYNRFDEEEEEE